MKATIQGDKLVIEIEITDPRPSASGKTLVIATSGGNKATTATIQGKPVIIGLNAYIQR